MNIEFTPWHPSAPTSCNEVIDAKGRTIAVVEEWDNQHREHVNLLATAPEMLEALIEIIKAYNQGLYGPIPKDREEEKDRWPEIYAASMIIAKAKGGDKLLTRG